MENESNPQLRAWWRHWSVVLILAILASIVVWGMLNLIPWLKNFQEWREARVIQKKLEAVYRQDTYGGKTTEETLSMFVMALKDRNIELASKYFVIEKQEAWIKVLAVYKQQGLLNNFVEELQTYQPNQYTFKLYPSGVWKIDNL